MPLSELFSIAMNTLRANKLRAALTLSGIVIGVFSIIAIMTLLNALQAGIEGGLSELGSNTFQVQNFLQYKWVDREETENSGTGRT